MIDLKDLTFDELEEACENSSDFSETAGPFDEKPLIFLGISMVFLSLLQINGNVWKTLVFGQKTQNPAWIMMLYNPKPTCNDTKQKERTACTMRSHCIWDQNSSSSSSSSSKENSSFSPQFSQMMLPSSRVSSSKAMTSPQAQVTS